MILTTDRLILRPWEEADAEVLYEYAKDPAVGPMAGWEPHTDVEHSRGIIRGVLSEPETYAVVLKDLGHPVGSAGLMVGTHSHLGIPEDEAEIGYWIGVPFWGQGLIPEAVRELQRYAFEELGMKRLWCCYYDGNDKSRRVQEKCGFTPVRTERLAVRELPGQWRLHHVNTLSREDWEAGQQ